MIVQFHLEHRRAGSRFGASGAPNGRVIAGISFFIRPVSRRKIQSSGDRNGRPRRLQDTETARQTPLPPPCRRWRSRPGRHPANVAIEQSRIASIVFFVLAHPSPPGAGQRGVLRRRTVYGHPTGRPCGFFANPDCRRLRGYRVDAKKGAESAPYDQSLYSNLSQTGDPV